MEDDLAGVEAIQTWTLVVLYLEELEELDLFGGSTDHAQVAVAVGEQYAGGGGTDEFDAA